MEKLNKQTALEFQNLISSIDEVAKKLNEKDYSLKHSTNPTRSEEYGYYIHSRDERFSIFFGLWVEFWVDYGEPLIVSLDTKDIDWDKENSAYKIKLSSFKNIATDNNLTTGFMMYQDYGVMIIAKNKIGVDGFVESLSLEIDEICKKLGFNLTTLR